MLWGATNFVIGLWLLSVGVFQFGLTADTIACFSGGLLIALILAWHFGRVRR